MAKRRSADPYRRVERVEVFLWGRYIGAVALDPELGFYVFAYDPDFARSGIEPAPLSMPLREDEHLYVFTELSEATYHRLPALLADALPDDFGNALIDRWLAERGVPRAAITPLDRLAYMGGRAMGALEFKPQRGPRTRKPTALELGELVSTARAALSGQWSEGDDAEAALRAIIEVGTSAGGARAKAVVAWNVETQELRSGQLDAPEGFQHWLLKFDGVGADHALGSSSGYGRIEYAYHLMAREAGIDMTECRLLEENGRAHFVTRRFDREGARGRHHVQTLCAMAHLDFKRQGTNSYAQCFQALIELAAPREDLVEAYRRMVFAVQAKNCDDHTKNISFRLRKGESWRLAPAYDVTFAHNPVGQWTSQHQMSVNGKFGDITRADLLAEAERYGIGEARSILDQVRAALGHWPAHAGAAGVAKAESQRIGRLHLRL